MQSNLEEARFALPQLTFLQLTTLASATAVPAYPRVVPAPTPIESSLTSNEGCSSPQIVEADYGQRGIEKPYISRSMGPSALTSFFLEKVTSIYSTQSNSNVVKYVQSLKPAAYKPRSRNRSGRTNRTTRL